MTDLHIYVPVWDTTINILFYGNDLEKRLRKLGAQDDDIQEVVGEDCQAITFSTPSGKSIIIIKKPASSRANLIGTISHEVFHAVQDLLEIRGVKLRQNDGNESHAYIIGYVMEEVAKRIRA